MVTVNLNDPNLKENFKALKAVRDSGMFTDEELQKMYDRQLEKDREEKGSEE